MNFDWIFNPLTPYAILALLLLVCLGFFVSVELEVRRAMRNVKKNADSSKEEWKAVSSEIQSVRSALGAKASGKISKQSIHAARNTLILQMHRKGEKQVDIAAALGARQNEIDLLLRVHNLTCKDPRA